MVAFVAVVEHVPGWVARDRWPGAAAQAAKAGHQVNRIGTRQFETGRLDVPVSVADDETALGLSLHRLQQPAANRKSAGGAIFQIRDSHPCVRIS